MPSKYLSNRALRDLLTKATNEERLALTKLLDAKQDVGFSHEKIQEDLCLCGGHKIRNIFRKQGASYSDILDDILQLLNIDGLPTYNTAKGGDTPLGLLDVGAVYVSGSLQASHDEAYQKLQDYASLAEEKIILRLLEQSYEKMDSEEKRLFDVQINEVAQEFGHNPTKKLIGAAGIIALGNLGGFATYTFLTSAMSTISLGSLGFGAYTTATSALSVLLGPAGWVGLGAAAVYSYGKPKHQRLIPLVVAIGTIRQRIAYEDAKR